MNFEYFACVVLIVTVSILDTNCTPEPIPYVYKIKEDITERKLLEVQIDLRHTTPYVIVTCFDYESLDNLNLSNFNELELVTANGISMNFVDCFNNETDHRNYKQFRLHNAIGESQNYANDVHFEIHFVDYGLVDGDTFFGHFNFAPYKNVEIYSVGFLNSSFLEYLNDGRILLRQVGYVNFDNFFVNTITEFRSEANTIVNFTKNNLAKFMSIVILKISDFVVYDHEMLNVPNLFERNIYLETLGFENLIGDGEIILSEAVFDGLHRLTFLDLKGINLETIHSNLFNDLPVLENLNLENNNLKQLDYETFVNNPALSRLQLGGNKLFVTQNVHLELHPNEITIDILKSQIAGFDSISSLLANSNIKFLNLNESSLKHFELGDFDKIRDRTTTIHITISDGDMNFSLAQLKAKHINYEMSPDLIAQDTLNAILYISADDSNLCRQCNFIQDFFWNYVTGVPEDIKIYLPDSKVLIKMVMKCTNLEKYYEHTYKYNCPDQCECRFNPLIDKIYVNCSNRGLNAIPKIPYPSQFTLIDSINLDMSKNLLPTINFDDQEDDVLKVMSTFDFSSNKIRSIKLKKKAPSVFYSIHLCDNDFLNDPNIVISLNVNDRWKNVTTAHCNLGKSYPREARSYIAHKLPEYVLDLVNTVRCNL